jgi:hypothetical protein
MVVLVDCCDHEEQIYNFSFSINQGSLMYIKACDNLMIAMIRL